MIKVYLYQDNREPYFWTVDELMAIENGNSFLLSDIKTFILNDIEFNLKQPQSTEFYTDGLNVLILNYTRDINFFKEIYNSNKDKNFLFIIKTNEDYAHVRENQHEEFINYVSASDNIKVIWDISEINYPNFYFEPKVHLQNYYNNHEHFPSDLFLNGKDFLLNQPNKKRIGIHFNKANLILRKKIIDATKVNDNLFFTINKDCYYNHLNNIESNYKSKIFDNRYDKYGFPPNKYIESFINFNVKSHMEVVYETFTSTANSLNLLKLNEKTIKHLFLGKPFIHTDPVAHKLLGANGLRPYESLYTKELFNLYESTNTQELLKNKNHYWFDQLINNINWLLDMNETEWLERINEAYQIAEVNRLKVNELIFNKSLINYIVNYATI
jgi:hypothetical protein